MRRSQVSLQDILRQALPEGARRRIYSTDLVSRKWEQIVGNELAQRSEPEALRDGVLTVRVTDAAWGKMIYRLQDRIVPELNRVLGSRKVRRINFTKRARLEHPAEPRQARRSRSRSIRRPRSWRQETISTIRSCGDSCFGAPPTT